ncbi:hypothetical protein NQ314_010682 [Rhamnusium bicolor]|uniref:Uncharacterized protein n=1 Tax=Rhamnusium bicolor TaxID=1586634 RepID=A0AAV8XPZ3_9CUCU|nr:hypothetical protein NQ314_010682 [Rhamnusium bicolor]
MIINKATILAKLLIIGVIINRTSSVSFQTNSINLCGNETVVYDNYTLSKTENCGCKEIDSCVRKCCRNGFYHHHDENPHEGLSVSVCTKNNSANFSVPIYDGVRKQYDLKDNFMIGMLDCKNQKWQYFKMSNVDPRQAFYIQNNGSLYYPLL